MPTPYRSLLVCVFLLFMQINAGYAQNHLGKTVSLNVTRMPLKNVLNSIGKQGNFTFSYNSNLVNEDSIVSIKAANQSVRQVLDIIFNNKLEYKETGKHIVLQRMTAYWYVSGYIVDEQTGERIINASVYEKQQLVASLTNEQGYFSLRLQDKLQPVTLNVSKSWYSDTSITIKPGHTQELKLGITPKSFELDSLTIGPRSQLEKNWLADFFLSSRQRMQSMNLGKFFVDKPYQASIIPGVSTHGRMSAQVVNEFSFNVLGGYTAGVNGFEIGGIFNIVKHNVRYAHIGGVFNLTGGHVNGVQVAGVYNNILDSANGVIVGGVANTIGKTVNGVQVSGVYGHSWRSVDGVQVSGVMSIVRDSVDGVQVSGVTNYTGRSVNGVQIAGVGNIAGGNVDGAQISALFNYAKRINGTQIAVINIADTSAGYSLGLINIVLKGYHKLSISNNEVMNTNMAFKTGNKKLYSILLAGFNISDNQKVFGYGYGIGSETRLNKVLSLNPEFSAQSLHVGEWEYLHLLTRLQLNLNVRLGKYLSVYAGPAFSVYYSRDNVAVAGFKTVVPGDGYSINTITSSVTNWFGWNVGIDIF